MNAHTVMSGKGQVVIPKGTRDRMRLTAGDQFEVVERPDGVLLRRAAAVPSETFDAITARIRARVRRPASPVTVAEMNTALAVMWAEGGPSWDR